MHETEIARVCDCGGGAKKKKANDSSEKVNSANDKSTPDAIDLSKHVAELPSLNTLTGKPIADPMLDSHTPGNSPGVSNSYANATGKPNRKSVNFRTLFTPGGNGVDVVVPVEYIKAISERFANTAYGFFLGKRVAYPVVANYVKNTWSKYGLVKLYVVPVIAFSKDGLSVIATKLDTPLMLDSYTSYMCLQSWGRSSYARAMIELRADVELKDIIVVAMSNLNGEGFYTCIVRVEYKWKPHRCACCKIFGHIQVECPKNPGLGVVKNLKTPIQALRGVLAGPKVRFKPIKEYRPVSKKPAANTSGTKKKEVKPTKEISNSNLFDVLNSIVNGGELDDHDSEDEVESVDNDMARSMASDSVDFGTKSLLEQWRDSYENGDYDEVPYDDDMYEGQNFPDKIQNICDNLDIRVRGRKKK
ncbi:hypothetical protein Tco_0373327 [Tanacetum coccineum]